MARLVLRDREVSLADGAATTLRGAGLLCDLLFDEVEVLLEALLRVFDEAKWLIDANERHLSLVELVHVPVREVLVQLAEGGLVGAHSALDYL